VQTAIYKMQLAKWFINIRDRAIEPNSTVIIRVSICPLIPNPYPLSPPTNLASGNLG
jgi:hypothetical protein